MTTGRHIKKAVERDNITPEELAEETGRPLVWAQRILATRRRPDKPRKPDKPKRQPR